MKVRSAIVLGTLATLALPAAAGATTYDVSLGLPPAASKVFQDKYGSDSSNFYPEKLQIRQGDSVRLLPYGFHDAYFPKKGGKALPFLVEQGPSTGENDAAGNPFWFEGKQKVGFNPALFEGVFGKTATYDGSKVVTTGLPLAENVKPAVVKFTKKGTFSYYCSIHPGMKGQVQVKSKKAKVPTPKGVKRSVAKQIAADTKTVAGLVKAQNVPAKTIQLGAAKPGIDYFGFLPAKLEVPVGTTVDMKIASNSREPHSVTFAPGDPDKDGTYANTVGKSLQGPGPFDGIAWFSSEAPGTVAAFTPALHGNGFWNSGILAQFGGVPKTNKVTFAQAGTYDYFCVIHTFMKGQVIVK